MCLSLLLPHLIPNCLHLQHMHNCILDYFYTWFFFVHLALFQHKIVLLLEMNRSFFGFSYLNIPLVQYSNYNKNLFEKQPELLNGIRFLNGDFIFTFILYYFCSFRVFFGNEWTNSNPFPTWKWNILCFTFLFSSLKIQLALVYWWYWWEIFGVDALDSISWAELWRWHGLGDVGFE